MRRAISTAYLVVVSEKEGKATKNQEQKKKSEKTQKFFAIG